MKHAAATGTVNEDRVFGEQLASINGNGGVIVRPPESINPAITSYV
jgi:hypothetical protein